MAFKACGSSESLNSHVPSLPLTSTLEHRDDVLKIAVDAIIERWKAKGCVKGQSHRLKKLFADGVVVDAEMEQAAAVTVTNARVCS